MENNEYNKQDSVFKSFLLNNQTSESEIDYFYILDHLEQSKLNLNEIKDIFTERLNKFKNNKKNVNNCNTINNKQ